MNKYQEALNQIVTLYGIRSATREHYQGVHDVLKPLVDKEIELQSRKDKLVVGSEWECVVEHYGYFIKTNTQYAIEVGEVVKIRRTEKLHNGKTILYFDKGHNICFDDETHFTLCFKPKGEK
jgi:hypothetical protein